MEVAANSQTAGLSVTMIFIAGPTASGKSEVALIVAEKLGGEIISVDSMQVYRGMDIGTAKPSAADRARVPHHLIDVVDLNESFDAAQFVRSATEAVKAIQNRGRVPIFCGGTGLYFKAFLDGLGDAPPANPELRASLDKTPMDELLAELEAKDPQTFRRIDQSNPRRVIRAVEVVRLTGRPFSEQRSAWSPSPLKAERVGARGEAVSGQLLFFGLNRQRDNLHQRIDVRVDAMFRQGLVAEVESLLKRGLDKNKVAAQALGYRQVIDHSQGGPALAETIDLVKLRTRQFAKRQMTWFRHQLPVQWIEASSQDTPMTLAGRIAKLDALRD